MNSQTELANGTQILSQSIYESILRKARGARELQQDAPSETQRTYEEGDAGHVDIMSSFVTGNDQPPNLEDSDPLDLSPVPTQHALTQYPESQRFKTPATAGKKRTYTGDVVDTPALPRNPLAREGQRTPGGMLGLSQAFAATQAASSPFSNGLPTGPRSDRPSPTIELQDRPATAVSSSPLRPITEFRRSATEPASKYVPMKHSQAERERHAMLQTLEEVSGGVVVEDEFDQESSLVARRRRQKEREQRAKEELRSLSSPIIAAKGLPFSSPAMPAPRDLDAEESTETVPTTSAPPTDDLPPGGPDSGPASEAETETEHGHIDVGRSSQLLASGESNKENEFVLVPKTGPRLRQNLQYTRKEIDASPSVRHMQPMETDQMPDLPSSEPFRIMDSQPSQSAARRKGTAQAKANPGSENVDMITDSSRTGKLSLHDKYGRIPEFRQPDTGDTGTSSNVQAHVDRHLQSSTHAIRDKSIPESEWEGHTEEHETASIAKGQGRGRDTTTEPSTNFESARTHIEPDTRIQTSQLSSPIRATPPGRKRRRLLEISAEASPQKLQSQPSFDAGAVLELDADEDVASLLQTSPLRSSPRRIKTRQSNSRLELPSDPSPEHVKLRVPLHREGSHSSSGNETAPASTAFETSQDVIKPGRSERSPQVITRSKNPPRSPIHARLSIFDIQPSPEQVITPRLVHSSLPQSRLSTKLKTSGRLSQRTSRLENRLQPDIAGATTKTPAPAKPLMEDSVDPSNRSVEPDASVGSLPADEIADEIVAPHMVLANYKGEPRGYYPAKVLVCTGNGFRIEWDGYEPEEVDLHGVKALDLRLGDAVRVLANGFKKIPYVIRGFKNRVEQETSSFTDIRGYQTVVLAPKQRKSLPNDVSFNTLYETAISNVYLDSNMWAQMKTRNQEVKPTANSVNVSGIATPVGRGATPSTPSSRGRRQTGNVPATNEAASGIFKNMTFAISYDDTARKDSICSLIQANGGIILHGSFHDLIEIDTMLLQPQYSGHGFTALLTDRHSRKEKYMQALALGLPCLSGKWIEACAKYNSLVDWQTYLLPAGESAELDNFTKSRVLPPFDSMVVKLKDMVDARPKIFHDDAAIIVMGRGKAETKRSPYAFLIRALGIQQVEKVPDLKSAKDLLDSGDGTHYTWIFVDDKDVSTLRDLLKRDIEAHQTKTKPKRNQHAGTGPKLHEVAGNELIVQSLILGKLHEA